LITLFLITVQIHWLDYTKKSTGKETLNPQPTRSASRRDDLSLLGSVTEALRATYVEHSCPSSMSEAVISNESTGGMSETSLITSCPKITVSEMSVLTHIPESLLPKEIASALRQPASSQTTIAGGGNPAAAAAAAAAASAMWSALVACDRLGLSFNASLAMSVALLNCRVESSEGES
jgi:hypothetical protein